MAKQSYSKYFGINYDKELISYIWAVGDSICINDSYYYFVRGKIVASPKLPPQGAIFHDINHYGSFYSAFDAKNGTIEISVNSKKFPNIQIFQRISYFLDGELSFLIQDKRTETFCRRGKMFASYDYCVICSPRDDESVFQFDDILGSKKLVEYLLRSKFPELAPFEKDVKSLDSENVVHNSKLFLQINEILKNANKLLRDDEYILIKEVNRI